MSEAAPYEAARGLDEIRKVPATHPLIWLKLAIGDLATHQMASLAYGFLVSLLGGLILMYGRHPYYIAAAITGFMLVGPVLTAGVCELSRRHDGGEEATFDLSLQVLRSHRRDLGRFALVLILIAAVWFLLSTMMMQVFLGSVGPDIGSTVWGDVLRAISAEQLLAYMLVGGGLACMVFAVSVVSVPLIIDRDSEALAAMRVSIRAALANLPAMLVWAALIVALVGIGFASFLVAMVVVYPLLGHATWYAYRDLVR